MNVELELWYREIFGDTKWKRKTKSKIPDFTSRTDRPNHDLIWKNGENPSTKYCSIFPSILVQLIFAQNTLQLYRLTVL